ncbi:MAG TPA: cation diffusion facilitator family transporter, partial [Bryobacteraceae bacterium]|nr:cation diffusion facilitator family transporter [Bryobacteraceae bacterium]
MQIGQRVALLGMLVSGSLALIKITTGLVGHSTATVADGLESAGDVFASGFVLLGLTLAAKPADENHPYGHGRVEMLTGFLIGLFLAAAGAAISYRSLLNIGQQHPLPSRYVLLALLGSALAKAALSITKFHYGRKLRSAALIADAWNDCVDILSALAALVAVGLTIVDPEHFLLADHFGGFAVGLIV